MNQLPPRTSIRDFDLESSEEVQLYLELIRIIEKDIDEIKAGNTRNGWTSWAIVGAIAGTLLLFFGETRKLQTFPTEDVMLIGLAGIFIYQIARLSLGTFNLGLPGIKPGKLFWSNDAYYSFIPTLVYKLLIFLTSIFVALTLAIPLVTKIFTTTVLTIWALLWLLILILAIRKEPLGNNKWSKKSGFTILFITLPLSIVSLILLITRMPFPLGEVSTLPYILAGLLVVTILLIDNLISTMVPSRLLINLEDLRNDIVFLRLDIDDALQRYETLTEGETLPDALKEELSEILRGLSVIEYAYSNMHTILEKMKSSLPKPNDPIEVRQQKQSQFVLDKDSYSLHDAKCKEIFDSLGTRFNELNKKLSRLSMVTEDWASENSIRSSLTARLQYLAKVETQLKQNFQTIDFYMQNPDKMPQQSQSSTDTSEPGVRRRRSQRNTQEDTPQT